MSKCQERPQRKVVFKQRLKGSERGRLPVSMENAFHAEGTTLQRPKWRRVSKAGEVTGREVGKVRALIM